MRPFVLASVGVAVVASCGGGNATAPRRPVASEYLTKIVIEGNEALPDNQLVPGLALERARQGSRAVDPYQLSIDTQRIRAAYLEAGFFNVDVNARVDLRGREQTAVFTVVEGPRAKIRVEIVGLPPEVREVDARALVALADGAPFDYAVYDEAKEPMLLLVENAGYPNARLDAAVLADRNAGLATARYAFTPGTRATFGAVSISGTTGDLADAIRGRLAFKSGEVFSAKAVIATQQALYELGRFSTVRIDVDRDAGAVVPVRIAVTPGLRHEFLWAVGGGIETEWLHARGRVRGSLIPKSYPLWLLTTDLRPGVALQWQGTEWQQRQRALVAATRLDLFRPRLRGEVSLAYDYITVEAYTSTGPRLRAGIETPLFVPWLYLRAGWVFELLTFLDPKVFQPVQGELGLDEKQRRGAVDASLTAEGRDNPLDPRRGWFATIRVTKGAPWLGGTLDYYQVTPELRGYLPLGRVVLAGRLRYGVIYGDVPVTERYYSGGANSHRGFADRRLSPSAPGLIGDEVGLVVIGGAALIETGLELRIPITTIRGEPFGTQIFLDGGDVTNTPAELDVGNLNWAVGLGAYLKVFGLKFRADFGYRLNRVGPGNPEPVDEGWARFVPHFGVGDTF
ncbi:MAG: BamA/TamA family outer membrane protein [Kofleriaceae bacterium]|nr:BamA/TamA family outer membrane protein [Kofleriaceae bacterium]